MASFSEWLTWTLRKASYKWHTRGKAMTLAKVKGQPNTYKCAACLKDYKKEGRKRIISADHVVPVKNPLNPGGYQEAIDSCVCEGCATIRRMFPATVEGWQMLCKACHDIKTGNERDSRTKANRKIKREKRKRGLK